MQSQGGHWPAVYVTAKNQHHGHCRNTYTNRIGDVLLQRRLRSPQCGGELNDADPDEQRACGDQSKTPDQRKNRRVSVRFPVMHSGVVHEANVRRPKWRAHLPEVMVVARTPTECQSRPHCPAGTSCCQDSCHRAVPGICESPETPSDLGFQGLRGWRQRADLNPRWLSPPGISRAAPAAARTPYLAGTEYPQHSACLKPVVRSSTIHAGSTRPQLRGRCQTSSVPPPLRVARASSAIRPSQSPITDCWCPAYSPPEPASAVPSMSRRISRVSSRHCSLLSFQSSSAWAYRSEERRV